MDCQGRRWYYVVPRAAGQSPARRAECEVCPCAALVLAAHVSRPRRPRPDAALSSHAAPPRHVHSARWAAHAGVEQQRGDRAVPQPAERQGGGSRAGQVGARPAGEALPPQSIALCCVPSVGSIASRTAGTVCGCDQPRPHTAPAVRDVAGRHRLLLRPLAAAACVHACMQCVRARTPARRRRGQAQACCVLGAGFPTPQTD